MITFYIESESGIDEKKNGTSDRMADIYKESEIQSATNINNQQFRRIVSHAQKGSELLGDMECIKNSNLYGQWLRKVSKQLASDSTNDERDVIYF